MTHDFDLADKADEVLVMQQGRIGARGIWKDLLARAEASSDNPGDKVGKCVKQYLQTLDQEKKSILEELELEKTESKQLYEKITKHQLNKKSYKKNSTEGDVIPEHETPAEESPEEINIDEETYYSERALKM